MQEQYIRRKLFDIVLVESERAIMKLKGAVDLDVFQMLPSELLCQLRLQESLNQICEETPWFIRQYVGDVMQEDFYSSLDNRVRKIENLYKQAELLEMVRKANKHYAQAERS